MKSEGRYVFKYLAEKQFEELPQAERDYWIAKTIPHTQRVFTYETSHAAWRYIPSTAIILDRDLAIPPPIQEALATAAGARIEHLDAGHGVLLSDPDLISQKIHAIVQDLKF